jgi:MFS family permease
MASLWRIFYAVSFLMALSSILAAVAPVRTLPRRLSTVQESHLFTAAAVLEMMLSSVMGSILDVTGRKRALWTIVATVVAVQMVTAASPSVVTLALHGLVDRVAMGFFLLTTQTIISDLVSGQTTTTTTTNTLKSTSRTLVSVAMGQQMAVMGLAFLLGFLGAGQVSTYSVSVVHAMAASVGAAALLLIHFGLVETLPAVTKPAVGVDHLAPKSSPVRWMLQSPFSCMRHLTRHKLRTLGVLLVLMTVPAYTVKQEWLLSPMSFSTLMTLYCVVDIAANTAGSLMVKAWGIRRLTTVAILSQLFASVAIIVFGRRRRGAVIKLIAGLFGAAQTTGVVAALISEGTKSGLPQGEMAGERAALVALLRVIGPIWYSVLYRQGQRWMRTRHLPSIFNIALSIMALVISQIHL